MSLHSKIKNVSGKKIPNVREVLELFRTSSEKVSELTKPQNSHRVRVVPALVLEPTSPRADVGSEPFRNYLRTVPNPRETLELTRAIASPALVLPLPRERQSVHRGEL
jgi:hypothetical protein